MNESSSEKASLNEFLLNPEFKKDRIILETLYLRISRALFLAQEKIAANKTLQVVFPFADAAIFLELALSISSLDKKLSIKTVGKLLSTSAMYTGAYLFQEERRSVIKDHMLEDDRLGKFDPNLPTLWVDSVVQFRILYYAKALGPEQFPAGNPAILFSTESNAPSNVTQSQKVFSEVWTPNSEDFLTDEIKTELEDSDMIPVDTLKSEGIFRLEMAEAKVEKNGEQTSISLNPQADSKRQDKNSYYFGVAWANSPSTEQRRLELIEASKEKQAYNATEKELAHNMETL